MEPFTGGQLAFCVHAFYHKNYSIVTARGLYRTYYRLRHIILMLLENGSECLKSYSENAYNTGRPRHPLEVQRISNNTPIRHRKSNLSCAEAKLDDYPQKVILI